MQRYGNLLKVTVTALLFIVLEAAALLLVRNNDIIHRQWMMRSIIAMKANIWGTAEGMRNYFGLRAINDSLSAENARLHNKLVRYEREISRMNDIKGQVFGSEFTFIPAKIVKGSFNRQQNYFILDKGSDDGIEPQMGVITDNSVVGVVEGVTRNYSYVISFMSPQISLNARLRRDGVTGNMRWDGKGSRNAILGEIPLHTEINPGDTVFTSGFSNLFPPDIPLGTAMDSRIVNGASLDISVSLFQEFRSLRYVKIVRNNGKDETDSLLISNGIEEE